MLIKNKYHQILTSVILYTLLILLNACGSGKGSSSTTTSLAQNSLIAKSNDGNINQFDLYQLNYGSSKSRNICTDQVCITLNNIPYAIFTDGFWLQEYYPTTINVEFKTNVSKFTIKELFNDLSAANLNVIGEISQINKSDCDALIKSGEVAGKSCKINLLYHGIQKNNQLNNQIIINFNIDGYDVPFDFTVTNHAADSSINWPIVDADTNEQIKMISLLPTNIGNDIGYPRQVFDQFNFVNYGILLRNNDNTKPTLNIAFADPIEVSGNDVLKFMYYLNPQQTDCGYGDITHLQTCRMPFNINSSPNDDLVSYFNNYLISYKVNESTIINSVHPFVVSMGELVSKNYTVNNINGMSDSIIIEKISLGESGINYSIPLNNFKLYLKYNPHFMLNSSVNTANKKLYYDFGSDVDYSQIVDNIVINYDKQCFADAYNPDYDGYDFKPKRSCEVSFSNILLPSDYKNTLGFDLYAEYNSPTENKHIIQLIGHISINQFTPNISAICKSDSNYKSAFYGSEYRCYYDPLYKEWGGVGDGTYTAILDYRNCQLGSGISNLILKVDNGTNSPTYLQQIKCNEYNNKFPGGDYINHCFALSVKGTVLSGICLGMIKREIGRPAFDVPISSSLDFSKCSSGVGVDPTSATLKCN